MVGVPGKSKGCNTCRKRKIRCDGQKPKCQQCQKSSRICAGYERDRYFKNLSALDRENLLARAQPTVSLTEPSWIRSETEDFDPTNGQLQVQIQIGKALTQDWTPRGLIPTSSFTINQLFGRFIELYIPRITTTTRGIQINPSWWQVVLDMVGRHQSLDLAVAALSMVGLGLNYHDDTMRMEGIKTYGRALDGMQRMLSSAGLLCQEETLATSLAMSKFEVFETTRENLDGWKNHISGLSQLIQLRGPYLHIDSLTHQLFLGFRPSEIIHALLKRKKTYLAEAPWLSIPWSIFPKDDFHSLLDILACLTGFVEQSREVVLSPWPIIDSSRISAVLTNGSCLEQELVSWYNNIATRRARCFYEEVLIEKAKSGSLFQTGLRFETFELFRMHSFYWAALLLLYNSIREVHEYSYRLFGEVKNLRAETMSRLQPDLTSFTDLTNLSDIQDLHTKSQDVATLLAKSINFLLSHSVHHLGVHTVFIPLRVALHTFSQQPGPEAVWCMQKFEELDRRGFPLAKILSETQWDDFPVLVS